MAAAIQPKCYNCHMSELTQAIITGAIQGATELLPVSSSGHILIFTQLTGEKLPINEIAILHIGTLIALIIVTWNKILASFKNPRVATMIVISTIPAGLTGLFFNDFIDDKLGITPVIMASLVFWGIIMIAVDQWASRREFKTNSLDQIQPGQAVTIGLTQTLALIPGTSRSGITTLAGIITGLKPRLALDFSFLSGIILIGASGAYSLVKEFKSGESVMDTKMMIVSLVISLIVGIIAARIFQKLISRRIFTFAGFYRILLGMVILISQLN